MITKPAGLVVKNPPAVQETWIESLGLEDPLEKEMATLSSTLAWRIPWTEEPGGLQSMGWQSQTQLTNYHFHFLFLHIKILKARKSTPGKKYV